MHRGIWLTASPRAKLSIRVGAQILGALVIVYLLIAFDILDFAQLNALLKPENAPLILAMALVQLAGFFIYSVRWKYFICHLGASLSMRQSITTGFRGLFTQLFIPGGLGLEGVRILEARRTGATGMANTLASLSADRIIGFAALFVLGSVLTGALALETKDSRITLLFCAVGTVCVLTACVFMLVAKTGNLAESPHWQGRWAYPFARTLASMASYTQAPRLLFHMLALAVAGHLFTCFVFYLGALVLALPVQLLPVMAISTIVVLARSVPFAPMGLGVVDITSELIFSIVGSDAGAELAMTVRAVNVVLLGLCGLAFLRRTRD